jgi:hypothetical protein
MQYKYDLPDFKRYLNDANPKNRVDGLIFWQNRIPIPTDLFNRMFNGGDVFFSLYIDYLLGGIAAYKAKDEILEQCKIEFETLPTNKAKQYELRLTEVIQNVINQDRGFITSAHALKELLGIEDYQLVATRLSKALCHQGKKFDRLFCPQEVKRVLELRFPEIIGVVGVTNTDMFGNVVADYYNIYRSGFGDALALIFNKHMEFRMRCNGHGEGLQRISLTVDTSDRKILFVEEKTKDGSLWEPDYVDDHVLRINPEHPFFSQISKDGTKALITFLYRMCEFEGSQFSDTQRKLLENMRQEISRDLWIQYDE